ncbi:MAG: transposase, partial [Acidobacteria bacterium]|nr:transposase [Acidobacteriota bacterium]
CAIALTVLRLLEIAVNGEGLECHSGRRILEEMSHLNSTWLWYAGKRMPEQALDTPTETQADVLKAFGWEIRPGGVLQPISS